MKRNGQHAGFPQPGMVPLINPNPPKAISLKDRLGLTLAELVPPSVDTVKVDYHPVQPSFVVTLEHGEHYVFFTVPTALMLDVMALSRVLVAELDAACQRLKEQLET